MAFDPTRIDPRLRVAFLLGAAVGVFFLRDFASLGIALGVLAVLWFAVGLAPRRLVRQIYKLWGIALFIAVSSAFFENDVDTDRWISIAPHLDVNVGAMLIGGVMFLRVLAVVVASQIARAGDPRAVAAGLEKLRVPESIAVAIDTVLALLGDDERHGTGGGRGSGGGRGAGDGSASDEPKESYIAAAKRLIHGGVEPIVKRLQLQIDRAERYIVRERKVSDAAKAKDVAIIAGISLTMLGIKALKILPSIPFAPGHKLVLLTPLYIIARFKTNGRFACTLTGLTMGTVAFLMGDGKYGVFEILKHVTPGLICDLLMPRKLGPIGWSLFGGLIAAGRFATIFMIVMLVQAPAAAWAILIPGLTVHMTFGIASGYVTHHLVRAMGLNAPPKEEPLPKESQ